MPLKLKDLDSKLVEAFKELMEFILLIDLRKPLKDLEKKVDNNYNKNIKYTDDEIAKLKLHLEGLIEQIQIDNSVDLTDAIEALRKELNLKIEQQNQYIDQRFEQMLENIETTIDNFKTEVNNQINVLGERVDTFDSRISNNSTNITNLTEVTLSLIYELIKSKKSTADKMQSLLTDKSSVATDKTKSEASILAVVTFLGETPVEGERYSFSTETLSEIYPLLLSALKDTTIYLNKCIEALRADIISIANKYTDLQIEELKEYIEERLKDVKPSVDLCEEIGKLPQQPTWGDEPRFLVHTKDGCITVPVSPEGIFTDVKTFTSFSGNVVEGGSNNFQVLVRNVSNVSVGEIQLVVVLPKLTSIQTGNIILGEDLISNPQGGTLTRIKTEDNIRTYKITKLNKGDTTGVSIPITWNTKGTFQASAQMTIIDKNVIDFDAKDDYSVSTCVVNAKSEGEGTVDCPLIECKLNGTIQVPVVTDLDSYNLWTDDAFKEGKVVKMREGDYLEFNYPITFINIKKTSSFSGYVKGSDIYPKSNSFNTREQELFIRTELVNIGGNKYVPTPNERRTKGTIEPIGIRVGSNCRVQFIWVIPADITTGNEEHIGKTIKTYVDNFKVIKGEASYTVSVKEDNKFEIVPVISTQEGEEEKIYIEINSNNTPKYNVTSYDEITLNIKKSSKAEIYIVGDRRNYLEVGGNVKAKYDIENKKITVETTDTATSRDSTRAGDLIINVIE